MGLFKKKQTSWTAIFNDVRKDADSSEAELQSIDSAKDAWLREHGLTEDSISKLEDLKEFVRYFEAQAQAMQRFAEKLVSRAQTAEKWGNFMEQAAAERLAQRKKLK